MNKIIILFLVSFFSINIVFAQDSTKAYDTSTIQQTKEFDTSNSLVKDDFKGYIQDNSFSKAGIFGGIGFLNHLASYSVLPGSGDCGLFDSGDGFGYFVGALLNYSIFDELLSVSGRINYDHQSFNFEKITSAYQVYNPLKNDYENLVLNNVSSGEFKSINFSLGIESKPFSIPFIFNVFLNICDANFGTNYEITQNIESPQIYKFNEGSNQRSIIKSKFTNSTALSVSPSIAYEFELSKSFYLSPYFEYSHPLTSTISEFDWKTTSYKLGISLYTKFFKYPELPPVDTIPPPVIEEVKEEPVITTIEEPKIPSVTISSEPVKFTETIVTQTYPILPYIFFDSSKTEIKNQYLHNYSSDFTESNLPKSTLEIYYYILDLVGSRMKLNPDINIRLTGTTDGLEGNDDDERISLAESRAENIAKYFKNKWQIDAKRIEIRSSINPRLKTNSDFAESNQENRRVEIYSTNSRLLEPVIHSKFQEFKINESKIRLNTNSINSENLSSEFNLTLKANNQIIHKQKFDKLSDIKEINIVSPERISEIEKNPKNVSIEIDYKDLQNKTYTVKSPLQTQISKEQFELGRLNLIVFDFNKSVLSNFNQNVISEFIDKAINPNSEVNITGSTDRLGEKDYNKKLSQQRANSVYEFMKDKREDINFKEIIGIGDSKLNINNDLPEGRFYSRTVLIESKTPLK